MNTDSKIFLVYDDPFRTNMYREHLQQLGFINTATFYSGTQLLNSLDEKPGVIFLDYFLEDYQAAELLEQIKTIVPGCFVVIVSRQSEMEITIQLLKNGAFDYIIKDENEAQKIAEVMGRLVAASHCSQASNANTHDNKYLQVIMAAQEKVRKEIAGELHDNVNQLLGASKLYIETARRDEVNRLALLDESKNIIETAIDEVTRISRSPAASFIKSADLKNELLHLVGALEKKDHFTITTAIQLDDLPFQLPARLQYHVYRIIQEQLNNIIKYAAAKQVHIGVSISNDAMHIHVNDDGIGCNAAQTKQGLGFHHIIDRVTKLQGTYSLHTAPGNGCSWVIDIPLQTITEQQLIVSH